MRDAESMSYAYFCQCILAHFYLAEVESIICLLFGLNVFLPEVEFCCSISRKDFWYQPAMGSCFVLCWFISAIVSNFNNLCLGILIIQKVPGAQQFPT